jgi:hypothetical protein
MLETDLAYLAGVIDSDGCITINKNSWHNRLVNNTYACSYSTRLSIGQVTNQAVLLAVKMFGGNLRLAQNKNKNRRPLYDWRLTHRKAVEALKLLLPYLKIKHLQAKNCIYLHSLCGNKSWETPSIIDGEPLITGTELAKIVGAKQKTILQGCRTGAVPSIKKGKFRMVPLSFADVYLKRVEAGRAPKRQEKFTKLMEECYFRGKKLNQVGTKKDLGEFTVDDLEILNKEISFFIGLDKSKPMRPPIKSKVRRLEMATAS